MQIASMTIRPYAVGLARPLWTARQMVSQRCGWIVETHDGEGRAGFGEAAPLPGFSVETYDAAHADLLRVKPLVLATQIESVESIGLSVASWAMVPSAAYAVEQALLDLLAQAKNIPLAQLLNPQASNAVPTARLVTCAEDARDADCSILKLKVGQASAADDELHIETIGNAAGIGTRLRLDANGAWTLDDAKRFLNSLDPETTECIEQPLAPGNLNELAALRRAISIRVALDESVRNRSDLDAVLAADAADVVVIKPMLCGGLIESLNLCARARDAGVGAYMTTSLDAAIGRMGVVHGAAAAPAENRWPGGLDTGRLLESDVASGPLVANGMAQVPAAPGLGVSP